MSVPLTTAARGDLPAAELGRQLGPLIRWTWVKQQRVIDALQNAATRGAHREVWQVLRTLLPALLPARGERPHAGLAKLVKLAVTVANWVGARDGIPGVAAIAAHKNTSMLTQECRRLHEHLTRP